RAPLRFSRTLPTLPLRDSLRKSTRQNAASWRAGCCSERMDTVCAQWDTRPGDAASADDGGVRKAECPHACSARDLRLIKAVNGACAKLTGLQGCRSGKRF